ncbi:hypothetical protein ABZ858_01570 [Streptomyces sp. NPDC047017]|uniref:hypothetical protein n=1 Tax=Streptomyces sp. NPDC047017 TaxID=3155024 RepID=UPI0034096DE6
METEEIADRDTPDPAAWPALDASVRQHSLYRLPPGAPALLLPGALSAAPATPGEERLALELCHRDGRRRERAVRRAAAYPALLPLVVIRATDWAAPVREAARALLDEVLDGDTAVALAPLILLMGRRERGGAAVELLDRALRRAPAGRLGVLLGHPERTVRRFAHRVALAEGRLSPVELAATAARDADVVVQTLCGEAAVAALADGDATPACDDVLAHLLGARSPQVRAIGVTALRRTGRAARATRFLADRSALVRACARYVVRQDGADPPPWYRERCARAGDRALPPGAVTGLAECGERADAALLLPLLAHPAPAVRARAVAGLRALDATDTAALTPLLDDPAPAVVRETTTALLPSARSLDAGALTARLAPDRPWYLRVAAFRLLDACGGLVRLRAAVALLEDPDERLRQWAEQSVRSWYPTADVPRGAVEAGELLARCRHLLGDHAIRRRLWEAGLDG